MGKCAVWHFGFGSNNLKNGTSYAYGPSVNKEYLSQIQLYSIFSKLSVMSNTVLIITVCVKVAKSTFLVTNKKGQSGLSYRGITYTIVL